jgi:predicted acylesterase/phospholipase RssA
VTPDPSGTNARPTSPFNESLSLLERKNRSSRWRRRLRAFLLWLLFHRFHLALAALFFGFPWLAEGPLASMAANLFVLSFREQVAVGMLAIVLGQVLVVVTWMSTRSGPLRLWPGTGRRPREGEPPDEPDPGSPEDAIRLGYREFRGAFRRAWGTSQSWQHRLPALLPWLGLALAAPTLAAVFRASAEVSFGGRWGAIALAFALAELVLLAAAAATAWLTPLETKHGLLEGPRWIRRLARSARKRTPRLAVRLRDGLARRLSRAPFGPGYVWVNPQGNRFLHSGHLASAGMFFATLAVYAGLGIWNAPGTARTFLALPALGALLLVLLMATWVLPALSFLLDRFRAPVVLVLLLVSFLGFSLACADHYFDLVEPRAPLPASADVDWDVVDSWFKPGPDGVTRPIIAVAAAGGGITASAWTAAVLTGLASGEDGAEFLASLKLISGVSGGAVGAMFFLDGLPDAPLATMGPLSPERVAAIRAAASASSLDAVGWGLAYPDLLRTLAPLPFAKLFPRIDRSWALEETWRRRLAMPDTPPTLAQWRADAIAGKKPLFIANATSVETGDRVLFSTLAVEKTARPPTFWGSFDDWDIAIPTAVRLSATFPFVSLAALAKAPRSSIQDDPPCEDPHRCPSQSHFVDGGYAENSGVLTAIELLERALTMRFGATGQGAAPPIFILHVRPFDPTTRDLSKIEDGSAWLTSVASPLKTLTSVRDASQVGRSELELRLFESSWKTRGVVTDALDLPLGGLGPLSWKLTAAERRRIRDAWDRLAATSPDLGQLRTALDTND